MLIEMSSITSSDSFTLSSARLNKPQGWISAETPFSAIPQIQLEPRVSRSETASSKTPREDGSRFAARNWIAVNAVQSQQKNENKKHIQSGAAVSLLLHVFPRHRHGLFVSR